MCEAIHSGLWMANGRLLPTTLVAGNRVHYKAKRPTVFACLGRAKQAYVDGAAESTHLLSGLPRR